LTPSNAIIGSQSLHFRIYSSHHVDYLEYVVFAPATAMFAPVEEEHKKAARRESLFYDSSAFESEFAAEI
jgi:hypothetical protein